MVWHQPRPSYYDPSEPHPTIPQHESPQRILLTAPQAELTPLIRVPHIPFTCLPYTLFERHPHLLFLGAGLEPLFFFWNIFPSSFLRKERGIFLGVGWGGSRHMSNEMPLIWAFTTLLRHTVPIVVRNQRSPFLLPKKQSDPTTVCFSYLLDYSNEHSFALERLSCGTLCFSSLWLWYFYLANSIRQQPSFKAGPISCFFLPLSQILHTAPGSPQLSIRMITSLKTILKADFAHGVASRMCSGETEDFLFSSSWFVPP